VGLGFLWDRNKPGTRTIGAPALIQTEQQEGRLKLVGFKMEDSANPPPRDGSIIVDEKIHGYVCTSRYSVSLKETIGLALVDDALTDYGTRLSVYEDECNGRLINAIVTPTPFYDPEGNRMKK
jgi:sarcosine oxidase subunit alpha